MVIGRLKSLNICLDITFLRFISDECSLISFVVFGDDNKLSPPTETMMLALSQCAERTLATSHPTYIFPTSLSVSIIYFFKVVNIQLG